MGAFWNPQMGTLRPFMSQAPSIPLLLRHFPGIHPWHGKGSRSSSRTIGFFVKVEH